MLHGAHYLFMQPTDLYTVNAGCLFLCMHYKGLTFIDLCGICFDNQETYKCQDICLFC
jgi:hypothetical protein